MKTKITLAAALSCALALAAHCAAADQAWRFGLGAQYQLSDSVNIGAACTFMWTGDMSVSQQSTLPVALGGRGNVSGSYEDAWFTFASVNLTWKF